MKFLLVANTGWYLYNFRLNLARTLRLAGAEVVIVCPPDAYSARLEQAGFRWLNWPVERSGMNPWREWAALRHLVHLYRREHPDLVHHFTIKCVVYGTAAARRAGVRRVVNSVTGLGHVLLSDNPAMRLLRPFVHRWYSRSLAAPGVRTIFQNRDDLAVLAKYAPELAQRAALSNGSGVDLMRFSPQTPVPQADPHAPLHVLFAGRLIEEKGIRDFVDAARILSRRGVHAQFVVCGAPDAGNPSSVSDAQLKRWRQEGDVDLRGHVDCLENVLCDVDVVVLPSYREGTPRVLLEAAAMAKPIVATDVPGCREVVAHGETGLLVPPRAPGRLADAIETLLQDGALRRAMGRAGRRRAENQFDERQVIQDTLAVYEDTLGPGRVTTSLSAVAERS